MVHSIGKTGPVAKHFFFKRMMMKMMWTMMTKKRKYAVVLHFMMKMMLTKKENRPRGGTWSSRGHQTRPLCLFTSKRRTAPVVKMMMMI